MISSSALSVDSSRVTVSPGSLAGSCGVDPVRGIEHGVVSIPVGAGGCVGGSFVDCGDAVVRVSAFRNLEASSSTFFSRSAT